MNKKHSKEALNELRSYNAEHEKRDSEGRFTSEHGHRGHRQHHSYTERCRDEEGRFAPKEDCDYLHDKSSKDAQKEKTISRGCFEK